MIQRGFLQRNLKGSDTYFQVHLGSAVFLFVASWTTSVCAGLLTRPAPGLLTESGIDAYRTPQPFMTAAGRPGAFVCISIVLTSLNGCNDLQLMSFSKAVSAFQGLGSPKHHICELCLPLCQEL